jgi:hypothetical protein
MVVTAVLLLAVLAVLLGLTLLRPFDVYALLSETNTTEALFNTLLSGTILLVSVVVSINSVVLSQEITDLESQQEQVDASISYRRRLGALVDEDITPARPAEFLRIMLHVMHDRTHRLKELTDARDDPDLQRDVDPFVTDVLTQVWQARSTLEDTRSGTFGVLLVGLRYDHSKQLRALRLVQEKHGDGLTDEQRQILEHLVDTLKYFATGREYFKSIYYKQELARLSSRLLYVSLPAIVFISYVILSLDAALFPEVRVLWLSPLLLFVTFSYTVALTPYIVLTSYVLRATTVTLQTVAAGPFILGSDSTEEPSYEPVREALEWEEFEEMERR